MWTRMPPDAECNFLDLGKGFGFLSNLPVSSVVWLHDAYAPVATQVYEIKSVQDVRR